MVKTETINFRTFMKREKPPLIKGHPNKTSPVLSVLPINIMATIDPVFIGIASGILLVALLEKGLASSGHVPFAAFLSSFLKISFPIAGLTALWFILGHLKFLF